MENISHTVNQIQYITNFQDFVSASFHGKTNVICWNRKLVGDFSEIVKHLEFNENITELHPNDLLELQLSEQGQLAREILLRDLKTLKALGASPTLNLFKFYDRDAMNIA
ncbi:hypothetical protein DHD32_14590 [Arenibacter sp. TNZ]|jgi:hypothetical protein|uniref:hypothetical protein n=1 Tax=Arenibacter TaxID=178469 RepID=UPI000CD3D206|nr:MULTISPECIES: hypothetical protein [Arenibacter]MCM4172717.1 hypothetical protein [Arenibacter sp. TNZ]